MFESILIAEDHESASISLRKTLTDLGMSTARYVYYCDDALMCIEKGMREADPVELLITDLSFEEDERRQDLLNGAALIAAARRVQPGLRVLVFSAEHRDSIINSLFDDLKIDGYVRKARRDSQELKAAIEAIYHNKRYRTRSVRQFTVPRNTHHFTEYDITVITLLANGMRQKDIPAYLNQTGIRPSGLSSIEKRLNLIKETLEFSKNEQLIAFCKDMKII